MSRDFVDGVPSSKVTTLLNLGSTGLVIVEISVFLFTKWPQYRSVTWLCGWGPLILSDHPAKFRVHRPYGTGNNGICNISSNSNSISNSNVKVPMPRFTNGHCEQCNQYRFVNMFARLYDVLCFLSLHKLNLFRSYSIILYHDYLNKRNKYFKKIFNRSLCLRFTNLNPPYLFVF